MLTINVIGRGDDKLLNGTLCGEKFNLPYSVELLNALKGKQTEFESFTSGDQVPVWEEEVKALLIEQKQDVIETACPDLKKDGRTGYYYVVVEGETSKTPVPEKLVAVILESIEKDINPEPIVKAWIRFLRDPNFTPTKAERFAYYITALIVDEEEVEKLIDKEGLSYEKAVERATYNDVCITTEGLLVTKKYGRLLTEGWDIDPKTNEPVKISLFPLTPKTVNKITGVVDGNKPIMPDFAEELYFEPPVQGKGGDEFFNGDEKGHIMQVGKKISLEFWNQVNTDDYSHCVKGLHVGGFKYVQAYKSSKCQLLECFVDPAEIGAICDLDDYNDGAIRVREYFIYGAFKGRTKGIYHSSTYAKMKDEEWEAYKLKAVEEANKIVTELQATVDNLGK
jgi:hypothetical protein